MADLDDRRLDATKVWSLYLRLAQIQLGTLVNAYDYHSIKRMIAVDGDDPLAERIVEGIRALPSTETDGGELTIDPPASMAALFQAHPLARSLKPKLFVGFDLRTSASVCGMLTACSFESATMLYQRRASHNRTARPTAYRASTATGRSSTSWRLQSMALARCYSSMPSFRRRAVARRA